MTPSAAALPPRVGVAGWGFRGRTPEELIRFLLDLGVHGLDYWPWNRGELAPGEFRKLADAAGIAVYCVNVPGAIARVADPGAGPDAIDAIIAAMDEAVELGAGAVQVYSAVPDVDDEDASARALADSLRPLVTEAAQRGLILTLENNLDQRNEDQHRLNPSRTAAMIDAAIRLVDSPNFRVCYDPCNFVAVGEEEYPLGYEVLRPYVVNLHLKDCRRYVESLHSAAPEAARLLVDSQEGAFLPTALGAGAVSWTEILERVVRDGYVGWMTLDPFISDELVDGWCVEAARWLAGRLKTTAPAGAP
jgi:sugar phosphate isomerase/epimerase